MECGNLPRSLVQVLTDALYRDADGSVFLNISTIGVDCENITPVVQCSMNVTDNMVGESILNTDSCGNNAINVGIASGGSISNVRTINVSDTQLASDEIIICDGTDITLTLLEATGSNTILHIKNINTTDLIVEGDGADTIDDELNQTLSQWESMMILDYAVGVWLIL